MEAADKIVVAVRVRPVNTRERKVNKGERRPQVNTGLARLPLPAFQS